MLDTLLGNMLYFPQFYMVYFEKTRFLICTVGSLGLRESDVKMMEVEVKT
jgi:hypothetical protein